MFPDPYSNEWCPNSKKTFFVALIVIIAKIYIAEDVKIIIKSIVVLVSWVSLCTAPQLQHLNINSGSMMKRRMKRSVLTFQGTLHHNLNPKPKRIEFIVIYPLHFSMTPFRCKEPQKCIKLQRSRIILYGILSLSKIFL